jgi:hypothetical protein
MPGVFVQEPPIISPRCYHPYRPEPAMERPPAMKRISHRPEGEDPIRDIAILQRTINRLRGGALVPRGVYRFATHEEADRWMIQQIAATHARRSSKTS